MLQSVNQLKGAYKNTKLKIKLKDETKNFPVYILGKSRSQKISIVWLSERNAFDSNDKGVYKRK